MKKDKELLLKDLCARLPYDVVVHADDVDIKLDRNHRGLGVLYYEHYSEEAKKNCGYNEEDFSIIISGCFYGHDIKPYLFPFSSMTEEHIAQIEFWSFMKEYHKITDFYYENHIDYLGLIEKGLAIDATGKNIY